MSLFSYILQKSIESEDKPYVEVKGKAPKNISDIKFNAISIKSDIDVKLTQGKMFSVRFFAVNPEDACNIQTDYKISSGCLSITVIPKKENLKMYISISVPDNVDSLTVHTNNSDVILKQMNIDMIKVLSSNGDIEIYKVTFTECISRTDNGDIHIHLNSGEYKIKAVSKTGDITMRNVKNITSANNLIMSSSKSGDIIIVK